MTFTARELWLTLYRASLIALALFCSCQGLNGPTDIIWKSSSNWVKMVSSSNNHFTGRNAHATCVFKGKLWLVGGRTDAYTMYNFEQSFKAGDVWYSEHGATWVQISQLKGDFFAQNTDVKQPGPIAPFYQRFGHSLDAVDLDRDGTQDYMILLGGFAPDPMNDVWITVDGTTWVYCGHAPWSPRAWHSTTIFQQKLWVMGGSPLNNEVWSLEGVEMISRHKPLTRAMYMNYTYKTTWKQHSNAPWSPRVGIGSISHWYFNVSAGETYEDSKERLMVIGGFGGWPTGSSYEGFRCMNDVWMSLNGSDWILLNNNASFGARAWFAASVFYGSDPKLDIVPPYNESAYIFLIGGGNIGFSTNSNSHIKTIDGRLDCFRSRDGVTWTQTNFEEGGGTTFVTKYSSQEWSSVTSNGVTQYLGMYGMTVELFNTTDGNSAPDNLILIGGTHATSGTSVSTIYRSAAGLFCDISGRPCNGHGVCGSTIGSGCSCDAGYAGLSCNVAIETTSSAYLLTSHFYFLLVTATIANVVYLCI